jgi:glucose-1-phosphate adenylyltransferase
VLGIILGGGAGSRLYPLTKKRAKPAVPLGANYRLIDIPVSNCINSGVNKIYCLTQFNSASLNRHLSQVGPPLPSCRPGLAWAASSPSAAPPRLCS